MKRKAIVLGGSGFIGSHLVDSLLDSNWQVINFDVKNYTPKKLKYYDFVHADLTNGFAWNNCDKCFEDVEVVFHLAGISGIQDCLDNPCEAINNNIITTMRLLEVIKSKNIILVFSSSMYANSDLSGIYGITKKACEDLIKFYHKQYGLEYLLFRVGTVYGTRANHFNSMTNLIQNALETGVISYYGIGEETREYIHVKDVAQALIELSIKKEYLNSTYEITGVYPLKAKDMIAELKELLGDRYQVKFRKEKVLNHYEITPYRYAPEIVKKYIPETCYSFGAGLLEVIQELDNEKSKWR